MNSYLGYAEILMEHHQYDRAVRMLKAGIELSYQQANAIYRSDLLKALSRCYEEDGMLVEALKYHKLYQLETDSLYNAEKERAVGEIRAKYDMERQENEIKQNRLELLEKENKMQLLIAGFICIFIAASLLYYLYYRKNKLYLTIVKQNQDAIRREQQLQNKIDEQFAEIGRQSALLQEYLTDSTKTSLPQPEKYASSSLTDEKKQDLFLRLETLLREEKVFTDNLLTKEKVAEMLGTNRTYLSQIINEQTKQTFTQFVNGFRTKEAVRSLSDPDNQTPLKAISAELGFNSMTTFYSQFQAATGMTPAQYRNKVQELHKIDNLLICYHKFIQMRQLLYLDNLFCYNLKLYALICYRRNISCKTVLTIKRDLKVIINSINIKSIKSMKHSDYHGKLLRLAMFFVALFLCGTMAYAQTDRMISGIVVDENGDPLPAAHIRQVSQTKGEELAAVITDMNGHFRLTLLRTAKEIEISYLGYESKKVRLTSANSYRIVLEPASELLDEVVVTGYQTISRERATGSFAKVDSKKLETQRLSSVSSLMEGRIAGYSDGKIRGVTSMNGLTTPLYVIDGFPVEKTISDGLGNWVENVPDLNIEDIENITVLKDAAATSIYGARAANGVVVITTKKAGKNQLNVSFSATLTVRPYNFYTGHLAGTADMIEMERSGQP